MPPLWVVKKLRGPLMVVGLLPPSWALTCLLAAGSPEEPLMGASTVGSEGVKGAAATTPATTAALVGLPCSSWISLPPHATSLLLLMLTRSL